MKSQFTKINIVSSILWASAIIAAAIMKAPVFFTLMILPFLSIASLLTIESVGRRPVPATSRCR